MSKKLLNPADVFRSRRTALRMGIGSVMAGGLASVARGAVGTTATPAETEGPFWEDLALNRSDIRTDSDKTAADGVAGNTPTQAGFPLYLTVGVSRAANGVSTPLSGARVDVWHANAYGNYSGEPSGMGNANTLAYDWLRGYQTTGSRGTVNFVTIWPGFYAGRSAHVHCRIRTYTGTTTTLNFTTQFFFDDAVSTYVYTNSAPYNARNQNTRTYNSSDNIYNTVSNGSTMKDGDRLLLRLQRGAAYATASYNVVVA